MKSHTNNEEEKPTKKNQTNEIFVKDLTRTIYTISDFEFSNTLYELKQKLEKLIGVPAGWQRLMLSGQLLTQNDKSLSELNFEKNITLHLVVRITKV